MTDLVITAGDVVAGANAKTTRGVFGEAVTAGQAVYREAATQKFKKSDADSVTAEVRGVFGVALNGGSDGQPATIQTEGDVDLGATLTVGEIYVLSDTAGGIKPVGDLGSGDYVTVLGVASSAANLKMKINESGAAVPGA